MGHNPQWMQFVHRPPLCDFCLVFKCPVTSEVDSTFIYDVTMCFQLITREQVKGALWSFTVVFTFNVSHHTVDVRQTPWMHFLRHKILQSTLFYSFQIVHRECLLAHCYNSLFITTSNLISDIETFGLCIASVTSWCVCMTHAPGRYKVGWFYTGNNLN